MKTKLYFAVIVLSIILLQENLFSQTDPCNGASSSNPTFWARGGNTGTNNVFGTVNNVDINIKTFDIERIIINGTKTPTINGVSTNTSGFVGIGTAPANTPNPIWNCAAGRTGPWSLLHLQGPNNSIYTNLGWRQWMRTGTFTAENSDAMYVGLKSEYNPHDTTTVNRSDAIINWSDDAIGLGSVDKLRFIFTAPKYGTPSVNPLTGYSLNGYEFMRMVPSGIMNSAGFPAGYIGIGPVFTNVLPPQSRLHINAEDNLATYVQITNQTGTGQTATDGTRLGILDGGTAVLYNQEDNHIIFSTAFSTPTSLSNTRERVRFTDLGAPTTLPNGSIGLYNPAGLPNKTTRVSISEDPAVPVTRPLSLLHLGTNTGTPLNPAATDGWRTWMDVGMFVSYQTDDVYLGLKQDSTLSDRWDAVLSWGDNEQQSLPGNSGPDNFRIIFAATQTPGTFNVGQAINPDGLEALRISPANPTPLTANLYTGIGGYPATAPFQPNPYSANTANPQCTVEINSPATGLAISAPVYPINTSAGYSTPNQYGGQGYSGLRFTDLTSVSPVCTSGFVAGKVLTVDANGDVILAPETGGTPFFTCGTSNPADKLPSNSWWEMMGNNFVFSGQGTSGIWPYTGNSVGIGTNCSPIAKLHVFQNSGTPCTIGILDINRDLGNASGSGNIKDFSIGFISQVPNTGNSRRIAGIFNAHKLPSDPGPFNTIAILVPRNGGNVTINDHQGNAESYPSQLNVNGAAAKTTGPLWSILSDIRLKKDISRYLDGLNIIRQLNPINYKYNGLAYIDTTVGPQVGIDAQQFLNIAPYMVDTCKLKLDSTDLNYTDILYINPNPLFYATINAIKQLDSISTGITARIDTLHTGIGSCAQPTVLTGNSAISLNNHNMYFTSDSSSADVNNIIIGKPCSDPPLAKLDILQNTSVASSQGIFVLNHSSGFINTVPASGIATMVDGASSDMSSFNAGGFFQAKNATLNCGVLAEAVGANNGQNSGVISVAQNSSAKNVGFLSITNGGSYSYGYKADIGNATNNFGFGADVTGGEYTCGLRTSVSNGTLMNYGVYASAPPSNASGSPHNAAGYFEGDIVYTGAIYKASDIKLKENIVPISNAMNIISQLEPKTFNFKTNDYPYLSLPTGKKYGLIAQDVETVLPELVSNNMHPEEKDSVGDIISPELSYKSINYEEFIPIMIKGMKEQQQTITGQQDEIDSLKSQINYLQSVIGTGQKTNSSNESNMQYVELENVNAIILNQNDPNPFAEETNITYYIPDDVSDAKLMFYDNNGKIIKEVELTAKGNGTLHVYASNLSAGIYSYALVADGKVIDTKKMMKSK